jgi:glutamine amidotransferase-like uncharacterized protein
MTARIVKGSNVLSEIREEYQALLSVLIEALEQAQDGKGKIRHQAHAAEKFTDQVICEVGRRLGTGYNLGQAVKKIYESEALDEQSAINELFGAINYIAAAIILIREKWMEHTNLLTVPSMHTQATAELEISDVNKPLYHGLTRKEENKEF